MEGGKHQLELTWLTQRISRPRSETLFSHPFPLVGSSKTLKFISFLALYTQVSLVHQNELFLP